MRLLTFLTVIFCFSAHAHWTLKPSASSLHFLSTKNGHITEVHQFKKFDGVVSIDGQLEVNVDLASVDTQIEIRNQRMQDMLFEVSSFAKATISAQLPTSLLVLQAGQSEQANIAATLTLHGKSVPIELSVTAAQLSANKIMVTTTTPTLIKAADFGLEEGVVALQKIAGLKHISQSVPVTFTVTFIK